VVAAGLNEDETKSFHAHLFNDILTYSKSSRDRFKLYKIIELHDCSVSSNLNVVTLTNSTSSNLTEVFQFEPG
jgi:hypothetical protein